MVSYKKKHDQWIIYGQTLILVHLFKYKSSILVRENCMLMKHSRSVRRLEGNVLPNKKTEQAQINTK